LAGSSSALAAGADGDKRAGSKPLELGDKSMQQRIFCLAFLLLALFSSANRAGAEDSGIREVPLLSTGNTVMGETLHYPTSGPAHVTAAIATFAPGMRTILHRHGAPLFAYILDGEITVDYGGRGTRTYHQGEALMEAMDVAHFGSNTGTQPVRLLILYIGAEGVANVIPER
jgi:quercetin dioxygenase-like cupin family protein